jgi:hypothetical protein
VGQLANPLLVADLPIMFELTTAVKAATTNKVAHNCILTTELRLITVATLTTMARTAIKKRW